MASPFKVAPFFCPDREKTVVYPHLTPKKRTMRSFRISGLAGFCPQIIDSARCYTYPCLAVGLSLRPQRRFSDGQSTFWGPIRFVKEPLLIAHLGARRGKRHKSLASREIDSRDRCGWGRTQGTGACDKQLRQFTPILKAWKGSSSTVSGNCGQMLCALRLRLCASLRQSGRLSFVLVPRAESVGLPPFVR